MATATVHCPNFPVGTDVEAWALTDCDVARRTGRQPMPASAAQGEIDSSQNVAITTSAAGVYCLFGVLDEVQTVTVDATGGTFTLTFEGQTTGAIAYNASATTGGSSVRALLEALSNVAVGEVECSGGPGASGGGTPYSVVFRGTLGGSNRTAMTANSASLTGGVTHTATIATGTEGAKEESGIQRTVIFTTA